MKYKLSNYLYTRVKNDTVVVYHLINHCVFAITSENYNLLSGNLDALEHENPVFFSAMSKLDVIIPAGYDELDYIKANNRKKVFDTSNYRLTINPTLECNFHCWYCYEHHPKGRMSGETMQAVVNHLKRQVQETNLQYLILDWFGGEPLLYFDEVMYPLSKDIREIMGERKYLGSITTNGYLINEERFEKFKEIGLTNYQITLDGDEAMHDSIRFLKGKQGSFRTIIDNINLLSEYDANTIMVRINYTTETLKNINNITKYFSPKAKEKVDISFQQVWQDSMRGYVSADENRSFFESCGFRVHPFTLNTDYHVCYADLMNEAVINFDGRVFKCTARNFTTQPEDGMLMPDGRIEWHEEKFAKRFGKGTFENEHCLKCKLLPVCFGPCSQKMVEFNQCDDFQQYCLYEGMKNVIEDQMEKHYEEISR